MTSNQLPRLRNHFLGHFEHFALAYPGVCHVPKFVAEDPGRSHETADHLASPKVICILLRKFAWSPTIELRSLRNVCDIVKQVIAPTPLFHSRRIGKRTALVSSRKPRSALCMVRNRCTFLARLLRSCAGLGEYCCVHLHTEKQRGEVVAVIYSSNAVATASSYIVCADDITV